MSDGIYGRYRTEAYKDSWFAEDIKSGEYRDIPDVEMLQSSKVDKAFERVDQDIQSILRDLSGVKGIDLIDDIRQRLEWISEKIQ